MWVLVLIVCGSTCTTTPIPGYYTEQKACSEAAAVFNNGDSNWHAYRRDAFCIPAPDNLGYE